jgi:hypothetical protein
MLLLKTVCALKKIIILDGQEYFSFNISLNFDNQLLCLKKNSVIQIADKQLKAHPRHFTFCITNNISLRVCVTSLTGVYSENTLKIIYSKFI